METFKLYGGEVTLAYDHEKHMYTKDGKYVPNVTTINSIINKKELQGWALRMGADYFKREIKSALKSKAGVDELVIDAIHGGIKTAADEYRDESARIGTLAHNYAEDFCNWALGRGEPPDLPLNEKSKNAALAFVKWYEENDVEIIDSEFKIFSRTCYYAGTVDIDCVINGERCLVDLKTSNSIQTTHLLQLAAYRYAVHEETGVDYPSCRLIQLKKTKPEYVQLKFNSHELDSAFEAFSYFNDGRNSLRKCEYELRDTMKAAGMWVPR